MPKRFRLFTAVLTGVFLLSAVPVTSRAVSTSATAVVLMDADSGRVLYASNADSPMLIASITKIMTALVAIECGRLSDVITVSKEAATEEGSSMYLKEGEQLTLETLLYGLLLCSGNDAAIAIAEGTAGSVDAFVDQMNERAEQLGMHHSSFANPNGLDAEGHYSTAMDMAYLACAAMECPVLMRIASTTSVSIDGRTMSNHNRLLRTVEGCVGLKTGYTKAAGRTLVSCVERNGQRLVAVTLQDANDWVDHEALFAYGFANYPEETLLKRGDVATLLPVIGGSVEAVEMIASDSLTWPVQSGETLDVEWRLPQVFTAPVKSGTVVGKAILLLDGIEVTSVDLIAGTQVAVSANRAENRLARYIAGRQ